MKEREQSEDRLLMDYVLGKLPSNEEIRIEEQYVADARQQGKLIEIEDELVDRYLEGQLSQEERRQLETRFLSSPRGRRKLQLARSLITVASEASETKALPQSSKGLALGLRLALSRFPLRFTFAIVALVLFLMLAWSVRDRVVHGRGNMRAIRPKSAREVAVLADPVFDAKDEGAVNPTVLTSSVDGRPESPPATAIAEILLQPVSRELVRTKEVSIHSNTEQLRIQVEFEGNRKTYAARLLNANGQIKWAGHNLRVQSGNSGRTVTLLLPAILFESGEYTVLLSSDQDPATPLAEYSFVVRKD